MKRTSIVLFIGAICLAVSGQWLLHAQLANNNPLVHNPNMVDRPRTSQRDQMLEEMTNQPITWTKPTGPEPKWLERGRKRFQSIERIRDLLAREIETQDLHEVPLASVLGRITESLEIPIFYDSAKMASESGFSQDIKITLQYRGNLRTFLDRLLEPYSLTYVINESGIEITTTSWAAIKPSLVVYDLSFLFPDSKNIKSLVGAIEFIVDPTESSSDPYISFVLLVDSRLIVATNERVHVEIESLLASLAPTTSTSAASVLESGNKMAPNDKKPDAIDPLRGSNFSSDDPFAF